MGEVQTVCDEVLADLTSNVSGLATAIQHAYAAWDPTLLYAEKNTRHVAVYPVTEEPVAIAGDFLENTVQYSVLVWEFAGDTASRLASDSDADLTFLTIWEDVRNRFGIGANQFIGSTEFTRYAGTRWGDGSGTVRSFELNFVAKHSFGLYAT